MARSASKPNNSMGSIILASSLIVVCLINPLHCSPKDSMSWDELGVSLSGKNPSASGKDVKIFVSPQRRLPKGYGEEDSPSNDPSGSSGLSSSSGSAGGQQTVSFYMQPNSDEFSNSNQQSSNGPTVQLQSPQSQAYSTLSASLASLKSRLNRGTLQLSHNPPGHSMASSAAYEQQSSQQQPGSYININQANGQSHESGSYSQSSANNDNKTIVLAIPAKINFLTDGKSSSSSKQSQQDSEQQSPRIPSSMVSHSGPEMRTPDGISYTIDSSGGANYGQQQTRTIYLNSQSPSQSPIESTNDVSGEQQYVIVNSDGQETKLTNPSTYSGNYPLPMKSSKSQRPTYTFAALPGRPSNDDAPFSLNNENGYGNNGGCLDMCYGPENRWRKYSDRRYRSCCRTTSDEQQASDKLSDSRIESDQYNYQQRRVRSRAHRDRSRPSDTFPSSLYESGRYGQSIDEDGRVNDRLSNTGRSFSMDSRGSFRVGRPTEKDDYEALTPDKEELPTYPRSSRRSRKNRVREHSALGFHQVGNSDDFRQYEDMPTFREQSGGEYTDARQMLDSREKLHSGRPDEEESMAARPESRPDSSSYEPEQYSPEERYQSESGDVEQSPSMKSQESETPSDSDEDSFSHAAKAINKRRKSQSKIRKVNKYQRESKSYSSPSVNLKRKKNGHNQDQGKTSANEEPASHESVNEGFEENSDSEYRNRDTQAEDKDSEDGGSRKSSNSSESAVSSLSRTTNHLKQLLSLLEKKAKAGSYNSDNTSVPTSQTVQSTTTTTTTTPPPSPTYSSSTPSAPSAPSASSALSQQIQQSSMIPNTQSIESAILSDFSFKSPFSGGSSMIATSGLTLPNSFSLPSSLPDTILSTGPQTYQLPATYLTATGPQPMPRKRRVNKGMRYRNMQGMPPQGSKNQYIGTTATLLGPGKGHSVYYPSIQYPMWYRSGHHSPLRHLAPMKLGNQNNGQKSQGSIFDEPRQQFDTLSSVASSLRPTAMRFIPTRAKSLIYQPHVLPIYTRHTILAQPMDIVK